MKTSLLTLIPPGRPIEGSMVLPGSKSYTNRSLVAAALARGKSVLTGASMSDDSEVLIKALKKLGVKITVKDLTITVEGCAGDFKPFEGEIDIGAAGTAMRFLTAVAALVEGDIIIRGSKRMHERPVSDLVDALRELGCEIEYLDREGCPPLRIRGVKHRGPATVKLSGRTSSQFFSALLLIAPAFNSDVVIKVDGEQVSRSYIDMTLATMRSFGVTVENKNYKRYSVAGRQHYIPQQYHVEGDASGASYFWGLAAVSKGSVLVKNISPQSAQGDVKFPEVLKAMGCKVEHEADGIRVSAPRRLHGTTVDMNLMPDTAQTLAVIAATAGGTTEISGLQTLKAKETDRIAAVQNELAKVGIVSRSEDAGIAIIGGTPNSARISTYEDHRMAMSFAMLGACVDGIQIENPQVVNKSFPTFWDEIQALGIKVQP